MLVAQNRPAGSQTPSFIRMAVGAPSVRVVIQRSSPGSVTIAMPVPAAAIQLPGRPNHGATDPSGTSTAASTVGGLDVGSASARVSSLPDMVSTWTSLSPVHRTPSPSSQRYPLHAVGSARSMRQPFGEGQPPLCRTDGSTMYPGSANRSTDHQLWSVLLSSGKSSSVNDRGRA